MNILKDLSFCDSNSPLINVSTTTVLLTVTLPRLLLTTTVKFRVPSVSQLYTGPEDVRAELMYHSYQMFEPDKDRCATEDNDNF